MRKDVLPACDSLASAVEALLPEKENVHGTRPHPDSDAQAVAGEGDVIQ